MNLDSTSTSPTPAQVHTDQAPSTSLTKSAPIPTSTSYFSILPNNTINSNPSATNPSSKKQKLKPSHDSSPLINNSISPSSSPNINVSPLQTQTPSISITPKNTEIIIRREKLETLQRECAILMKELDISELTSVNDNTSGNDKEKDSSSHTSPLAMASNISDGNNESNETASNTFNKSITPGNVSPLDTYAGTNGNVNGKGNDHQKSILKRHIRQLNKYNELKDVALSLVSLIADQKQVSIKSILEEMNVDDNDDGDLITDSNPSTKSNAATVVGSAGGKQ
ncbi:unnamed protein product [Ambrosiozyma monospora]|uniref:Unnamed protein product n=1 Tax=Ambrosiozyma monospora TaxID=43982 RepID=A0ACB5SVK9_AMBMO|nr:unnamed protein product [Ambrosiozyma monospora]